MSLATAIIFAVSALFASATFIIAIPVATDYVFRLYERRRSRRERIARLLVRLEAQHARREAERGGVVVELAAWRRERRKDGAA